MKEKALRRSVQIACVAVVLALMAIPLFGLMTTGDGPDDALVIDAAAVSTPTDGASGESNSAISAIMAGSTVGGGGFPGAVLLPENRHKSAFVP